MNPAALEELQCDQIGLRDKLSNNVAKILGNIRAILKNTSF